MITFTTRPGKKGLNISLRIKNENINTAIALGISVTRERWNEIQDVLSHAKASRTKGKTVFIDDLLISQLFSLLLRVKAEVSDDVERVYPIINEVFRKKQEEKKHKSLREEPFVDFIATYADDLSSGKTLARRRNAHVSLSYIQSVRSLLNKLVAYQADRHRILYFKDIDMRFSSDFKSFLLSQGKKHNTIGNYLGKIKTIMSEARDRKLTSNTDYMNNHFGSSHTNVDNVYLTQERIDELYMKEFKKPLYSQIRDMFVFGCETGQRFSDFSRISQADIVVMEKREFFHIYQKKTSQEVFIPVTKRAKEILCRYNGRMPGLSYVSFIRGLGIVCEKMSWDEYVKTMGKKFYQCVTSHTARRSFATNAYKRGVPLSAIMAITGHTSEAMLRKYLKLDKEESAILAAKYF